MIIEETARKILGLFRELSLGKDEFLMGRLFYARTSSWERHHRDNLSQAVDKLVADGMIVIVGDDLQLTENGYDEAYK